MQLFRTGVSNSWASGGSLRVGNIAEVRVMFFDLEIITSPGNDLCNVARSEVDLQKKKEITTFPASPHHCPSSGIVSQKSSSVSRSENH